MTETTILPPWQTPRKPRLYVPEYKGITRDQVSPLVYVEIEPSPERQSRKGLMILFARVFFGVFGGLIGFFVVALLLGWALVP